MNKKIVGIVVMALVMTATALPVVGIINLENSPVLQTSLPAEISFTTVKSKDNEQPSPLVKDAYYLEDDYDWQITYAGNVVTGHGGSYPSGGVGIGTTNIGNHKFYVTSDGSGTSGSTAFIQNTKNNGIGLWVEATSSDLPLLVSQKGSGPIFRLDSWTGGWHSVFGVQNDGSVGIGTSNPGSHQLYVESDGSGTSGSTAYIKNTHDNGLGLIVEATSNDLPLLVSQKGSGDIFRCDSYTGGWHSVFKVDNSGKTTCSVLKITGGSDIVEPFNVKEEKTIQPGMIVVIDPYNPGGLKLSDTAYDRCVAGVLSGAGGVKPGLMLSQENVLQGDHQVALAGRVYGLCDASYGAIKPGDLLTTSPTPGHAMKVSDYEQAQGAILGKAMTYLEKGQGLVLILVSLQ